MLSKLQLLYFPPAHSFNGTRLLYINLLLVTMSNDNGFNSGARAPKAVVRLLKKIKLVFSATFVMFGTIIRSKILDKIYIKL